ncbi:hypothetical protein EYC80_010012 [Monilinia laxa]|uniref:Heterokaryon incompatibility domain-containing protein n=1 Tax=Monilinia laxa TaxID=61186 RepID=A0A5N6JT60_MONLA|nr:hypothetical protein EYC80_010012 [Monilinia laxa]
MSREAIRQLKGGINSNGLCIPCKNALQDDNFNSIGTLAWQNDALPDFEGLNKPALYCCLCRHVLRAREFARRRGAKEYLDAEVILDWVLTSMEEGILIHDDGFDLDSDNAKEIGDFGVDRCEFVRSIQHYWADNKRIRGWLNNCEVNHSLVCNQNQQSFDSTAGGLLLIDVVNDCLCHGSFNDRYFALSYVWGQSKQFLTLMKNFQDLLKPGQLSKQPLTQKIRDAITFVRDLDEKFLWVDTVDDVNNKAAAITQMSNIYSQAIATIIAMSGSSADTGLPGVRPTVRNSSAPYIAPGLRITERTSLERVINEYYHGTGEYTYNTRAWTYQERLLSKRSIMFLKEQVYFQCGTNLLCEDRCYTDDSSSALSSFEKIRSWSANNKPLSKTYSRWHGFRWYEEMIVEYTAKNMSYPADIINAFIGLQSELSTLFDWKFVEGLPEPLLDLSLLWTPVENIEPRATPQHHPSWSWSGWLGRVWFKDIVRPLHLQMGEIFEPLTSCDVATLGTLRLDCETTSFKEFSSHRSEKRLEDPHYNAIVTPNAYFLRDKKGQRCGILYGPVELPSSSSNSPVELLRLSRWKRANAMYNFGPVIAHTHDGHTQEENLFDKSFEDREWCVVNVMLVRWWGAGYNRLALGQMHEDAWHSAHPMRKTIAIQ